MCMCQLFLQLNTEPLHHKAEVSPENKHNCVAAMHEYTCTGIPISPSRDDDDAGNEHEDDDDGRTNDPELDEAGVPSLHSIDEATAGGDAHDTTDRWSLPPSLPARH